MPHCECTQPEDLCKCNGCLEAFDCDLCPEYGCRKNHVKGVRIGRILCPFAIKPGYAESWIKLLKGVEDRRTKPFANLFNTGRRNLD